MPLAKHITSNVMIAGYRALVSCEGQPMTCYRCHETGHLQQECPMRQRVGQMWHTSTATSWANIATQGTQVPRQDREAVDEEKQRIIRTQRVDKDPEQSTPPGEARAETHTWAGGDRQKCHHGSHNTPDHGSDADRSDRNGMQGREAGERDRRGQTEDIDHTTIPP